MANPSAIQDFVNVVVEEFGDVLVHYVYFQTQDSAIRFVSSLSFVEQTSQGLSMPSAIKACVLEASDGAVLCLAGVLNEEQSLEIRKRCLAQGVDDQFLAISKSPAAAVCGIAQRVNDRLRAETATP